MDWNKACFNRIIRKLGFTIVVHYILYKKIFTFNLN